MNYFEDLKKHVEDSGRDLEKFKSSLSSLSEEEITKLADALDKDKDLFVKTFDYFYQHRSNADWKITDNTSPQFEKCMSELRDTGFAKVEQMFSDQHLGTLLQVEDYIRANIGEQIKHSGFIDTQLVRQGDSVVMGNSFFKPVNPNYGNARSGSKQWGGQAVHPGVAELFSNTFALDVFREWYKNKNAVPVRSTIDWMSPAPYNHNGWHIDVVRPQLKLFVLLDDVHLTTGPMYYAKKSHGLETDLEKTVKHELFKNGTTKDYCLGPRYGMNLSAVTSCHCGYVPDTWVDNNPDPDTISPGDITINADTYEKGLLLGKKGDAFFFESSGLHSGNFIKEGMRKTVCITFNDDATYEAAFLNALKRQS